MAAALRVAVADDEPDLREFLARMLTKLGYVVLGPAADGQELVELCICEPPHLVLTDLRMPGMDGLEAAALICRRCPVAVVLMTGESAASVLQRAESAHVHAVLGKPFRHEDLVPTLDLALMRFYASDR